ncbi:MAG: hypothetical protein ABI305_03935 [Tepidiformaceae bacterium]
MDFRDSSGNKINGHLWTYVVGVAIALIVVNCLAWLVDSATTFHGSLLVSGGFLLGILSMYIAVHLYRWK